MALAYVGSMALSALAPSVYLSLGEVAIALSASLQGNLALNASLSAHAPTLADILAAAATFSAELSAAATLGLPSISFSVSDCIALNANLTAALSLLVVLEGLLSASIGVYAYGYYGLGNALGGAVTSELATQWPDGTPTTGSANAMLFGAALLANVTPPTIAQTQMAAFLDGLPFTSGLAYAGKVDLATLSPVTNHATVQGRAAINSQLAATAALQASFKVIPYSVMLAGEANFIANLRLIPDVPFALQATAQAAANLSARFGFMCQLGAALARFDATVFVYTYTGAANALGAAITTALASTWGDGTTPTSGACTAALLGTVDSFSWTTLSAFFGGA